MRDNKLIQFYTTNMCNSKCKTCSIWKSSGSDIQTMPPYLIEKVVKEFPDADYVIGGGEFTLHPQRYDILDLLNRYGVNYTVLSNCVSYDRLIDIVDRFNIRNITVSCDGVDHDAIRGVRGNLFNIKTAVQRLYLTGKVPGFKISYTLSKYNENNIARDMKMFDDMGIDRLYFCIAHDMDLLETEDDVSPSDAALKYIIKHYAYMLYDKDKFYIARYITNQRYKCTSTENVHTIYTNGDVVYCQSYKSNVVIGNIANENLSIILERNKTFIGDSVNCPYMNECTLLCQRRYD